MRYGLLGTRALDWATWHISASRAVCRCLEQLSMTASLNAGDPAPDFTRPSASGELVSLRQFQGQSAVVLYFYPRDNTSVCTAEACLFRDSYEAFRSIGAEVIGVSPNSLESHRRFATQNQLPFHLLSDADGSLRALYGVSQLLWVIPNRVTFVIDQQGIVRHIYSAMFQAAKHVAEALRVLSALQTTASGEPSPTASRDPKSDA